MRMVSAELRNATASDGRHQVENISPKVFGDAVHLSPMLIIIAFVVGGYLGGILGLFVAVPVAATLRILFIYAHERVYA